MVQSDTREMEWTVGRLLNWTADYFKGKQVEEPMLSSQVLLSKVLGCSKVDLYLRYEQVVEKAGRDEFRELVRRAVEGEPIAYLVGHKEFFSLDFIVSRAVLIPRPETELLVQWVIRKVRDENLQPLEILDIGTGSGCIAVALAKYLKCPIVAVDKSKDAIELAKTNAERHKVAAQISFIESDLFSAIGDKKNSFSFIVSNPPYVTAEDYALLPKTIQAYEPRDALYGGSDGLDVIKKIVDQAGDFLKPGGFLVMEVGYNQSQSAAKLFEQNGFTDVCFENDVAGVPRVVIGRKI